MRIAARATAFEFETGSEIIVAAHRLEGQGRDIVHLDLGEPDFTTPQHIVEAAERSVRDGQTHYTPAGGLREARAAIAEHVSRTRGANVTPQQVIVTSGGVQALLFVLLAVVEEGDEVIVQDPCYAPYGALVQLAGGRTVTVPLLADYDFRVDLDRLGSLVGRRTRAILLNSPNNPTGGVLPIEDLACISELAERHGAVVISDEVYADIVYDGPRAPSILSIPDMPGSAVCVDSLSKAYAMCGWRIGYAVAPPSLASRLESIMLAAALCASSFSQAAAVEALTSPLSVQVLDDMRQEFKRRRDLMVNGLNRLPGIRCHKPRGAFYAFPDVSATQLDDAELARRLLFEGGVTTLPGSIFGSRGTGHLRLSYATSPAYIEEGLRRIGGILATLS